MMLAASIVAGCHPQPIASTRASQEQALSNLKRQANGYYDEYLAGDYNQAKLSLERSVKLADKLEFVPHYQAGHLFFCYARLYVLERRTGNDALAEAALVKARYWSLRERELGNVPDEEGGAFAKSESGDRIVEFIDKWDRDHTDGKGANYIRRQ